MTIISTLEDYLSEDSDVRYVDTHLRAKKWELTKDRYTWDVFNPKAIENDILALEKEREIAVASSVGFLKNKLLNTYSTDYYVFSIKDAPRKTIEIHRTNCICTLKLVNGNFEFCTNFKDAIDKSYEISRLINWDIDDSCDECLPYWDVVALRIEVENFYKTI
jgi:hypothetical protein